jgi:hypothetical protein
LKERVRLATTEDAEKYRIVRETAKMRGKRAEQGKLTSIVAAAKRNYQVDAEISIFTVRTRAKQNKVDPAVRQGTPSPILSVEPFIVDLCVQLGDMRVPMTNVTTGLQLANSLIAGTSFESEVKTWKQLHCVQSRQNSNDDGGQLLGWGYWKGFIKRHGHLIKGKKAITCDSKRADWCTYHNFSTMYYREV